MKKVVLPLALAGGVILSGGHHAYAVSGKAIVDRASQFEGTPYVYGSASGVTSSFDCSSFTQLIYKVMTGISLPRTAAQQATVGVQVSASNLQLGDLLFFNTTGNHASHVGIYVGNGQMISAESGYGVHVTGVFSGVQSSYWKPRFEQARRVIGYAQPAAATQVSKNVSASSTSDASGTTSSDAKTYTVKSGDTLWGISRHYGLSVSSIKSRNHLSSDNIYVGQKLSLDNSVQTPAAATQASKSVSASSTSGTDSSGAKTYSVKSGDTLWEISRNYGVSVSAIKSLNHLSSDTIYAGQKLSLTNAGQKSAAVSHSAKVSKKVASVGKSSAKTSYKVHNGDSLWAIATLHDITVNKLMKANNLSSTIIYPGMKLVLPN